MLTDPSGSLDASPKRSTFETKRFAGGADSIDGGGYLDLGLGDSIGIGTGADPKEGGALLDDPRRRSVELNADKAARVSSIVELNGSLSERDKSPSGSS